MWLVAELFETLPEAGDLDQPKLVFFLEEAHLLFDDATNAFLDSIERTVRLIRSKGVGVFFVTQRRGKCRRACSASSATGSSTRCARSPRRTQKALQATVSTYPKSDSTTSRSCWPLGIGEAAVTMLDERGVPTPVVPRGMAPRSGGWRRRRRRRRREASPLWAQYGDAARGTSRARAARLERLMMRDARRAEPDRPRPRSRIRAASAPRRARPADARRLPVLARGRSALQRRSCAGCSGCCASACESFPPFTERARSSSAPNVARSSMRSCVLTPPLGRPTWFPHEVFEWFAERGWLGQVPGRVRRAGDYPPAPWPRRSSPRGGSGGLAAGVGAHMGIASPPIGKFGTHEQKLRWLRRR